MALNAEQKKERSEYLERNLKITECSQRKPYVFISYASDNWETVFKKAVVPLQQEYGLCVYADKAFDKVNDKWIVPMLRNVRGADAIIVFVSQSYIESYACFLELLTAVNNKKQIVFVSLEQELRLGDTTAQPDIERGVKNEILNQGANISTNTNNMSNDIMRAMKSAFTSITTLLEQDALSKYDISDAFINFFRDASINRKTINDLKALKRTIKSVSKNVFDESLIIVPEPEIPETDTAPTVQPEPEPREEVREVQKPETAPLPAPEKPPVYSFDKPKIFSKKNLPFILAGAGLLVVIIVVAVISSGKDNNAETSESSASVSSSVEESTESTTESSALETTTTKATTTKATTTKATTTKATTTKATTTKAKTTTAKPTTTKTITTKAESKFEFLTYSNGDVYIGEVMNGKPDGQGTYTFADDGRTLEGTWDDAYVINPIIKYKNGIKYNGTITNGRPDKSGTYIHPDGTTVEAEKLTYNNGDTIYFGETKNGEPNGQGVMRFSNGDIYDGEWIDGLRIGQGVYIWQNGNVYFGEWTYGTRNGQGTMTYADGSPTESGLWIDNEFIG